MTESGAEPFPPPEQEKPRLAAHLEAGRRGEDFASRLLWKRGFRILARNYRGRSGEIDLIGEKKGRIHFVEVKTRTSETLGAPEERVDKEKQNAIRRTAEEYLARFDEAPRAGSQFDVVALVIDPGKRKILEQRVLEDAF